VIKKILFLSLGNFSGPLISFLTLPLITRLFKPEDLGEAHWIVSIAMVASIVFGFQIYNGILSEESKTKAVDKFYLNLIILLLSAFVFFIIGLLLVYGEALAMLEVFGGGILGFLSALNLLVSTLYARLDLVGVIAKSAAIRTFSIVGFSILFGGWLGGDVLWLVIAYVIGEVVVALYYYNMRRRVLWTVFIEKNKIITVLMEDIRFAIYYLPSQLISNGVNAALMYFIKAHSIAMLGVYSVLFRLVSVPIYSIGSAVKSVFIINFKNYKGRKWWLLVSIIMVLSIFNFGMFIFFISIESYGLLSSVLGDKWSGVDKYLSYFFIWIATSFVNVFPLEILKHNSKQNIVLLNELMVAFLKLIVIYIVFEVYDMVDVLMIVPIMFSIINVFMLGVYMFFCYPIVVFGKVND